MTQQGDSMFHGASGSLGSRIVRWGVPALLIAAGTLMLILGDGDVWVGIGTALVFGSVVVIFTGWFARLGDDGERVREAEAREHLRRTGKWPDRD